jgi:hypothetical protein
VAYPLRSVLADPALAAQHLLHSETNFGVEQATGHSSKHGSARLELLMAPLPALKRQGYPTEAVRITIRQDGKIHAFPRGDANRRFKHRNPFPLRDLCLQYPHDDPALLWIPQDGLEPLITLIHRHLMYEEAWRRTGRWPTEDAPHGHASREIHPVLTPGLQRERDRWAR